MIAIATVAIALATATNANGSTRTTCREASAPRLCQIHHHYNAANRLRARLDRPRIGYAWIAERYPARRDRVLLYWTRVHSRALTAWRAYLSWTAIPSWSRSTLLCIHPYEEPSWSTAAGGLGYISRPSSYASTISQDWRLHQLVSLFGDAWPAWPRRAQLAIGHWLYLAGGTYGPPSPWSTAARCS